MDRPKFLVARTDGTNCDRETARAILLAGGDPRITHINTLVEKYDPAYEEKVELSDFHALVLVGGFSHADNGGAGNYQAVEWTHYLGDELSAFIEAGKPIIGICNGFQVLEKSGHLPNFDGKRERVSTLTYNDSGKFEARWEKMYKDKTSVDRCIWTRDMDHVDFPVAHAEGKFFAPPDVVERLFEEGQVVFRYGNMDYQEAEGFPQNPNGSVEDIAGICDPTGLIFGLMPHPERYMEPGNHHLATLQKILSQDYVDLSDPAIAERARIAGEYPDEGKGIQIFRNGVDYCLENLM